METLEAEPLVCRDGTRRPAHKTGFEALRHEARRMGHGNGTDSNYPTDLGEMADINNIHRADFRYRRRVREHIEAARLTNSEPRLYGWERDQLDRANVEAREERKEVNRAVKREREERRRAERN